MSRHGTMLVAMLAFAPALSGCSFIGLGIGSAVTTYETVQPPYETGLAPGDEVRVLVAPPSPSAETPSVTRLPRSVTGKYAVVRDDALVLDVTRRRSRAIPLRDVQKVELVTGSEWATGLLVGALLDVIAASTLAIVVSSAYGGPLAGN